MIELLVDNRDGSVFDISKLAGEITWKTKRIGKPASLEFNYINVDEFKANNGNPIRFSAAGNNVFYGYIFTESYSKKEDKKNITAYDQMRYLLCNDTYVFTNKTANQIIETIAKDFQLSLGDLENTGYVIPSLVEDNKKLLDIIYSALDKTLIATGKNYVLYDDFGSLALKNINNLRQAVVVDADSNLSDFDYKKSIDNDTYNKIKVVKDNKESKKRDIYVVQDSKNIAKWGLLQYYHKAEENMNSAQIKEMADQIMKLKNKESKTFKLDLIGNDLANDIKLRAGTGVFVDIEELGFKQFFLIEEASHVFSENTHTMSLDLKVV